MGKYMRRRHPTSQPPSDVSLIDASSLGVKTRAKTRALKRQQKKTDSAQAAGLSYLQLRSRRLEKPPLVSAKKRTKRGNNYTNGPKDKKSDKWGENNDVVDEEEEKECLGENFGDCQVKERGTRESTPCNLTRDPEIIRTPGSSTRPTCSAQVHIRSHNLMLRHIPTAHDMDEFFTGAEVQQQQQFIEKYNFDPVNDVPLPGRYEWVKLKPKS